MGKKLLQIALEADKAAGVISEEEIEKLSDGWKDTLIALVERGPLFDGDVPSKSSRDSLMEHDYATRVIAGNGDSYWSNAATEKGIQLYKQVVLGKGETGTLEDAVEKRKSWDKEEDSGDHEFRGDFVSESAKIYPATEGLLDRITVKAKDLFKGKWKDQDGSGFVKNQENIQKTRAELRGKSMVRSSDVAQLKLSPNIVRSFWEGNDKPVPTDFEGLKNQLQRYIAFAKVIRDSYWPAAQAAATEFDRAMQSGDPVEVLPKFRKVLNTWFPTPVLRYMRPLTAEEKARYVRTVKTSDYIAAFQLQMYESYQRENKDSPVYQKNLLLSTGWPAQKEMKLPEVFQTLDPKQAEELLKLADELNKTIESFTLIRNLGPVYRQFSSIYDRFFNRLNIEEINKDREKLMATNEILNMFDQFAGNVKDVMDTAQWSLHSYIRSILSLINLSLSRMK